ILPAGFDWRIEQERGALALGSGYVYVPFGSRAGDCGNYHGYVVAVPTSGSTALKSWHTPDSGSGIWSPGGIVLDNAARVIVTTGNGVSDGCDIVNYNDAFISFPPDLSDTTPPYWMPSDWQNNWCFNDEDLGSATGVLNNNLAFQSGKWGTGFLVDPQNLGGVGGELFAAGDVCRGNHSAANYGSYAYAAPYVYLSCEGHGIVGLQVDTSAKTFSACGSTCSSPSWNSGGTHTMGAPIVAGGLVW